MTLLLVDDDIEMLDTLRSLIDWRALGYTHILSAANGADALAQCEGRVVDLLITDIGMPSVDGYALLEALRGTHVDLPCIFLTCHEDFSHAQRAIAVGTDDYIVKYSLTPEIMSDAVARVQQKRRERDRRESETRSAIATSQDAVNSYKERLLFALAGGETIDPVRNDQRMKALKIARPAGAFRVIGFYIDYDEARLVSEDESAARAWRFAAVEAVEAFLRAYGCPDEVYSYERYILLVHEQHDERFGDAYLSLLRQIAALMNDTMHVHVSICASAPCADFYCIHQAIDELRKQRDDAFYGQSMPDIEGARARFADMPYSYFNNACAKLRGALANETSFWETLDAISRDIERNRYEPHMVRKLYRVFLLSATRLCQQSGIFLGDIHISGMSFLFCRDAVTYRYQQWLNQRGLSRKSVRSPDINAVLEYINAHLSEKISLQTAADHIYKNSSHLSRLFKQAVGVSFSDYLIQARIQKATELLEQTELPVEEIALRVGIDNIPYFYKFYKRETGRTPRESR